MRRIEPECVWDVGAQLGEGPIWVVREKALWFTDIKKKKLHRFDPVAGKRDSFDAPAPPGFIVPLRGGNYIAGLKTGLHTFDPIKRTFELRHAVEPDRPGNRLNDAAVDWSGHLWFGSMDDAETEATGCLYRLEADGPKAVDCGYIITNGPAFSPDGKTLYHTDTLNRVIYAFDIAGGARLSDKRVFARIEDGAGFPDGPVVDTEGCVWTGLFAGWHVRRYSPRGEILAKVEFPCANITKIAFGGPRLTSVYATTAWKGLDAKARAEQPLAGALFRFEADVPGLVQHEVTHG